MNGASGDYHTFSRWHSDAVRPFVAQGPSTAKKPFAIGQLGVCLILQQQPAVLGPKRLTICPTKSVYPTLSSNIISNPQHLPTSSNIFKHLPRSSNHMPLKITAQPAAVPSPPRPRRRHAAPRGPGLQVILPHSAPEWQRNSNGQLLVDASHCAGTMWLRRSKNYLVAKNLKTT